MVRISFREGLKLWCVGSNSKLVVTHTLLFSHSIPSYFDSSTTSEPAYTYIKSQFIHIYSICEESGISILKRHWAASVTLDNMQPDLQAVYQLMVWFCLHFIMFKAASPAEVFWPKVWQKCVEGLRLPLVIVEYANGYLKSRIEKLHTVLWNIRDRFCTVSLISVTWTCSCTALLLRYYILEVRGQQIKLIHFLFC